MTKSKLTVTDKLLQVDIRDFMSEFRDYYSVLTVDKKACKRGADGLWHMEPLEVDYAKEERAFNRFRKENPYFVWQFERYYDGPVFTKEQIAAFMLALEVFGIRQKRTR